MLVQAPWTDEQVANLNRWQNHGFMHGFTCGSGKRGDQDHVAYAALHDLNDNGLLLATPQGWVCPVPSCPYTQDWAHDFMVDYTEQKLQEHQKYIQRLMNPDANQTDV
jgi:hypothetical protein